MPFHMCSCKLLNMLQLCKDPRSSRGDKFEKLPLFYAPQPEIKRPCLDFVLVLLTKRL